MAIYFTVVDIFQPRLKWVGGRTDILRAEPLMLRKKNSTALTQRCSGATHVCFWHFRVLMPRRHIWRSCKSHRYINQLYTGRLMARNVMAVTWSGSCTVWHAEQLSRCQQRPTVRCHEISCEKRRTTPEAETWNNPYYNNLIVYSFYLWFNMMSFLLSRLSFEFWKF